MLAYRIERENGIGPFQETWEGKYDLLTDRNESGKHPCPRHDGIDRLEGWYSDEIRFACTSIKKLNHWFAGFLHGLEDAGFMVVCYDLGPNKVNDSENWRVGHSGTQIAFIPHTAKNKWKRKISDVFRLTETENVV